MVLGVAATAVAVRVWWGCGAPEWTRHENPIAFAPTLLSRALSQAYVWARCVLLLLWPATLCCDWGMQSLPLVHSLMDARNVTTLLALLPPTLLACWAAATVLRHGHHPIVHSTPHAPRSLKRDEVRHGDSDSDVAAPRATFSFSATVSGGS